MDNDDYNRPISMDDTVTPISKQPVDQINADDWPTLSIADLFEQRTFLQTRLSIVMNAMGHPDVISQMQQGLQQIDYIIATKQQATESKSNPNKNSNHVGIL